MDRNGKNVELGELRDRFGKMTAAVFVDFKGMTVENVTKLRAEFRKAGVDYRVVKNTLVKHALKDAPYKSKLDGALVGMTGIAWSYEDPSAAAKVVKAFRKDPAGEKLQIKAGLIDPWRAHIREMAGLPNVVCKLSGATTEAEHKSWTREQLRPYIDHVIECFGPDRILYGGDWPVSELAGSYLQWLSTLDWATVGFSPEDKRKLFRGNAIKAYRLCA